MFQPFGLKLGSEMQVLGQQSLCVVRDKIVCRADPVIPGDMSEHPDCTDPKVAVRLSPFFIGEITPLFSNYNISGLVPVC